MSKSVFQTSLRLNLEKEDDRRAWEHLMNLDKARYKSYTRAIVTAINSYFDRQEQTQMESSLAEEKEEAFLHRVLETIERGLREELTASQETILYAHPQSSSNISVADSGGSEMDNAALEFIESL